MQATEKLLQETLRAQIEKSGAAAVALVVLDANGQGDLTLQINEQLMQSPLGLLVTVALANAFAKGQAALLDGALARMRGALNAAQQTTATQILNGSRLPS